MEKKVNDSSVKNQLSLETMEELDKRELIRENEMLRAQAEQLKAEFKLTKRDTPNRKQIGGICVNC